MHAVSMTPHTNNYTACKIGWVDFGLFLDFQQKYPKVCYKPFKSTENSKKKCVDPVTQNVLINDEAVTGSKHFFRLFSLLLKGM
jgi:hypothetical protein